MKVLVDENLPPALARALAALFVGSHEVIHLRDKFGPAVTDIEWIQELNREGRWIILSADRRISRNKAEQRVFRSSKLVAFILSPGLQKAQTTKKMERILAQWSVIETQAGIVSGGSIFEIQMKGNKLSTL